MVKNKHIFDGKSRISASALEGMGAEVWQLPVIDASGHLVKAESRPKTNDDAKSPEQIKQEVDAAAGEIEKLKQNAHTEGLLQGKQEGLDQGKQEGLTQGKQEGLELGKSEGLEQGLQQGLQESQAQLDEKLAQINKLLTSLTHSLNQQDYKLEQALLNLVTEISRAVVKRDLEISSEQIIAVVREAIAALPPCRDNIRVFVHDKEMALVREAAQHGGENWQVVADDTLAIGGCRVETEQSVVDFTVDTRFQTMISQILNKQLSLPQDIDFEEAPEPVVVNKTVNKTGNSSGDEGADDSAPSLAEQAQAIPAEPPLSQSNDTQTNSPDDGHEAP